MRWPTDHGDFLEILAKVIDDLVGLEDLFEHFPDRAYVVANVIEQLENLADEIEAEDV